jgi:cobalt-zinc-cadmium efflux system outer membrane protein
MTRRLTPLLFLALGCQGPGAGGPGLPGHDPTKPPAAMRRTAPPTVVPAAAVVPADRSADRLGKIDLAELWDLALVNNPAVREAGADVQAARGRLLQAGLYPNPRFLFVQDTIGSAIARPGNSAFEVNQEIVTARKRKLDMAVAGREVSFTEVGLIGRKFEALTRIRRAYYDYLALWEVLKGYEETVGALEKAIEATRKQVETAKTRPKTDLLRLEALLAEAKINQDRTWDAIRGAWRQVAAEVGVDELPPAAEVGELPPALPTWDHAAVLHRALATNSAIRQAAVEADRARVAVDRARAGAIPNVVVGGGYTADRTDQTGGGIVNLEVPLPLWDRQQGKIREAEAKLATAQAAMRGAETKLARDVADAFARYSAAKRQVERTESEVLPRLQESLTLLRKAFEAGSAQVTFADVLTTEQNLLATQVTLAEARRSLWQAIADLQGLMQLDVAQGFSPLSDPGQTPP